MADILLGNVKGPQGDTGATGSQGPQGDAATITVGTVSTTAYGNTASVTNSGTEQDAVLDFVIPQGKPGEQTTRMGALTLDTITAQSADFPIPAVGETGSTVFGKIIKFFNSTISALNSKLNISDVVNNLTSTSTTQPLSAAQGKALNDAIAERDVHTPMNTVTILSNANQLTRSALATLPTGCYIVQCASTTDFAVASAYGLLFHYGSLSNYHHYLFTNGDGLWKLTYSGTTQGEWQSVRPTYMDVNLTVSTAGTAMQISSASGYKVTYANFLNAYVIDTNQIVARIHTYNNLLYAKFLTDTGANAPAATYKLRCWYMP